MLRASLKLRQFRSGQAWARNLSRGNKIHVDSVLRDAVNRKVLSGTGISPHAFWAALGETVHELMPRNMALLARREELQRQLDAYHAAHPDPASNLRDYRIFLERTGYLEPSPPAFRVETTGVDPEIGMLFGPQLVAPIDNDRFAVNAANARWGSLLQAFTSTDAILELGQSHNRKELARAAVTGVLDAVFPLAGDFNHYRNVKEMSIVQGQLVCTFVDTPVGTPPELHPSVLDWVDENMLSSESIRRVGLRRPDAFVGFNGPAEAPTSVLLLHHGLHMEIVTQPADTNATGAVGDVMVEAALSAIADCEDSVAAVDGLDKSRVYANWAALVRGDLRTTLPGGEERGLAWDKVFTTPTGGTLILPGRAVLLCRNVGIHIFTGAVLTSGDGLPVPEHIIDAFVTVAAAVQPKWSATQGNSKTKSIYIVRPKLHGSKEVEFVMDLFDRVEDALNLPRNTVKVGIMDEERRTSLNLGACLYAARRRAIFVNTGFLDRTGDEIHSVMRCGPVLRKSDCAGQPWLKAYEDNNVAVGLAAALPGRGQIGKGMWAYPDKMKQMLATKAEYLTAGASTSWVPSPIAATLHALHYHEVDVAAARGHLNHAPPSERVNAMLTPPLMLERKKLTHAEIMEEVDANCQSILSYVSRWVNQGIGCSKVLNIRGESLMEDRATLRMSSQLLANWNLHGVVTSEAIKDSLLRMAKVCDSQNEQAAQTGGAQYTPFGHAPERTSAAFRAAHDLILRGVNQPNGYTEDALSKWRQIVKADGPFLHHLEV